MHQDKYIFYMMQVAFKGWSHLSCTQIVFWWQKMRKNKKLKFDICYLFEVRKRHRLWLFQCNNIETNDVTIRAPFKDDCFCCNNDIINYWSKIPFWLWVTTDFYCLFTWRLYNSCPGCLVSYIQWLLGQTIL